jgi:hypothetical protein
VSENDESSDRLFHRLDSRIVEVLKDLYVRPKMYGFSPSEIDIVLRYFHWFWGVLHQKEAIVNAAVQNATPPGRRSASGAFSTIFRLENPEGTEGAELQYLCNKWHEVSVALGIVQ